MNMQKAALLVQRCVRGLHGQRRAKKAKRAAVTTDLQRATEFDLRQFLAKQEADKAANPVRT
jgi:hypothetical protein